MRKSAIALTLALVAGCADEQPSQLSNASADADGATTATASSAQDRANAAAANDSSAAAANGNGNARRVADGQWFTKTHREGPWAGFGPPFSEAAFSARCEGQRLVFNTTEMPPSGPGPTQMRLSFAGTSKSLSATASEDGLPSTDAAVPATADWLKTLAAASGELTVTVGASDPLTVPISKPLTSLIRDCARDG